MNKLVATDAKGNVVSTGNASDCYLSDQASDKIGTQRRTLYVPVPGLKPSYRVEIVVTRRDLSPPESFPFLMHYFTTSEPAASNALFVQGKAAEIASRVTGGVQVRTLPEGRLWIVENPPVYEPEPFQTPIEELTPVVALGSAGSWDAVAKQYLDSIADKLKPDAEITALAVKQAGKGSRAGKIAALARFVQREITYKAIEFGNGARVPRHARQVLQNRYGDCKDHAVLLREMLGAIGVEARLVLVRSGRAVARELPSLDQFDHMAVWVPGEPALVLDATQKHADVSSGEPFWLDASEGLVLDPRRPRSCRWSSVPPASTAPSRCRAGSTSRRTAGSTSTRRRPSPAFRRQSSAHATPIWIRRRGPRSSRHCFTRPTVWS